MVSEDTQRELLARWKGKIVLNHVRQSPFSDIPEIIAGCEHYMVARSQLVEQVSRNLIQQPIQSIRLPKKSNNLPHRKLIIRLDRALSGLCDSLKEQVHQKKKQTKIRVIKVASVHLEERSKTKGCMEQDKF